MRFKEIAEFATISTDRLSVFLFGLYQLPVILPLTIPIACVIASALVFQKLSSHHELSALRAAGFSLYQILTPIFLGSIILALLNFAIIAEIGPRSKLLSKKLTYHVTSSNPFAIFSKMTQKNLSNLYIDIEKLQGGKEAKNAFFVFKNPSLNRLNIMVAKDLKLSPYQLMGSNISLISTAASAHSEQFDHLMIENEAFMSTEANILSSLFEKNEIQHKADYLSFKQLLIQASLSGFGSPSMLEIARKIALTFTPIVFTLTGASFGIHVGRVVSNRGILLTLGLVVFDLATFISAKSLKHFPAAVWLCYFVPLMVLVICSINSLSRVSKGMS